MCSFALYLRECGIHPYDFVETNCGVSHMGPWNLVKVKIWKSCRICFPQGSRATLATSCEAGPETKVPQLAPETCQRAAEVTELEVNHDFIVVLLKSAKVRIN